MSVCLPGLVGSGRAKDDWRCWWMLGKNRAVQGARRQIWWQPSPSRRPQVRLRWLDEIRAPSLTLHLRKRLQIAEDPEEIRANVFEPKTRNLGVGDFGGARSGASKAEKHNRYTPLPGPKTATGDRDENATALGLPTLSESPRCPPKNWR